MNQTKVVSESFQPADQLTGQLAKHQAVARKLPEPIEKNATDSSLSRALLHVAWMAILLGLIVEGLILFVVR